MIPFNLNLDGLKTTEKLTCVREHFWYMIPDPSLKGETSLDALIYLNYKLGFISLKIMFILLHLIPFYLLIK